MDKDLNDVYCLGFVNEGPEYTQKKDIRKTAFQLAIVSPDQQTKTIRAVNTMEKNDALCSKLRRYDLVQIKGQVQADTKTGTYYIYIIDIIRLNAVRMDRSKAVAKLIPYKEMHNNVYLSGCAVEKDQIKVKRKTCYKTITDFDVIKVDTTLKPPQRYTLYGKLDSTGIQTKGE